MRLAILVLLVAGLPSAIGQRPEAGVVVLKGHTASAMAWRPDGKVLATGGGDGTVRLWDATTGKEMARINGDFRVVDVLTWRPDGKALAMGSRDGKVRVLNAIGLKEVASRTGQMGFSPKLAWRPDGKQLAVVALGTRLWDPVTNKVAITIGEKDFDATSLAWRPDGKMLAIGESDGAVRLRDPANGKEVAKFEGFVQRVHRLAWRPDGKELAAASAGDNGVHIYDPATKKTIELKGVIDVTAIAWRADGKALAASADNIVEKEMGGMLMGGMVIWDMPAGKVSATLLTKTNTGPLTAMAYRPDGKAVAAAYDGKVAVWDPATGKETVGPGRHDPIVSALAWRPDGNAIASSGLDGIVRIWTIPAGK